MVERVAQLDTALHKEDLVLLRRLGELAWAEKRELWLVGGLVRDLFLGVESEDLDVVVEGDAISFARKVKAELKAELVEHPKFLTVTLVMPDGGRVDIATARTETYAKPGALPVVTPASISEDMRRRDFTINAMAVCLAPGRWGELFDPFGGRGDMEKKLVRVLHEKSFRDDPTRILRGLRFAGRLGFMPEKDTDRLMKEAVDAGCFDTISADRLREEFMLVYGEENPVTALEKLSGKVLKAVFGGIELGAEALGEAGGYPEFLERAGNLMALVEKGPSWEPTLTAFLLLMRGIPAEDMERVAARLNLSAPERKVMEWAPALPETVRQVAEGGLAGMDRLLREAPNEVQLAVLVMVEGEEVRQRVLEYLCRGEEVRPELTGDDLVDMGFIRGPVLGRILEDLRREKLEGRLGSRQEEIDFVNRKYTKPSGGAAV